MPDNSVLEESIFSAAIALPVAERVSFVQKQCGSDTATAKRIEALLALHLEQDDLDASLNQWLGQELSLSSASIEVEDLVGSRLGNYLVVERIGEGGTGVVYRAQQEQPLRREVAIKCVKPGMDTKEVLTRFAAERQTLAVMNHPGIAQVIDAGATEKGRPFFVMELVEGQPLGRFCDDAKMSIEDRLGLFEAICRAVEHAHQKGVIHRDLKPSNILVVSLPAGPLPKIIDFGIAKALGVRRAEDGTFTRWAEFIGTPSYMSPEQAQGISDLDTRTDIYSLGAVLYELLCVVPPLSAEDWTQGGLDALRRIKLESPKRPLVGLRQQTLGEQKKVAEAHGLSLGRLSKALVGDLDWVVLRCLEPERERRYATVGDLAEDVRRTLAHEPVAAAAPGCWYLVRKSVQRHRLAYVAGLAVGVTVVAGTWVSLNQAHRARVAEVKATAEAEVSRAVVNFLREDVLAQAAPDQQPDRTLTVAAALANATERIEGKFIDQPLVESEIRQTIGESLVSLGEYEAALPHLRRAWEIQLEVKGPRHRDLFAAREAYLVGLRSQALFDEAEEVGRNHVEELRAVLGPEDLMTLEAIENEGMMRIQQARFAEARTLLEEVVAQREVLQGRDHAQTLNTLSRLARCYGLMHEFGAAERRLRDLIERQTKVLGADDLRTLKSRQSLGNAYNRQAKSKAAAAIYAEVYDIRVRVQGARHPDTIGVLQNQGAAALKLFKTEEAVVFFEEALEGLLATLGPKHPSTLMSMLTLGNAMSDLARFEEAVDILERCYAGALEKFGAEHYRTTDVMSLLGQNLGKVGRYEEAVEMLNVALKSRRAAYGEKSARGLFTSFVLGLVMLEHGEAAAALPVLRKTYDYSLETNGVININTIYMGGELMRALLLSGNASAAVKVGAPLASELREQFSDRHILALYEIRLGLGLARCDRLNEAAAMITHAAEVIKVRNDFIPPADREQFARELREAQTEVNRLRNKL